MIHHGALVNDCSLVVAADAPVSYAKGRMAECYDQSKTGYKRAPPMFCYRQLHRALIKEQCMLLLVYGIFNVLFGCSLAQ